MSGENPKLKNFELAPHTSAVFLGFYVIVSLSFKFALCLHRYPT